MIILRLILLLSVLSFISCDNNVESPNSGNANELMPLIPNSKWNYRLIYREDKYINGNLHRTIDTSYYSYWLSAPEEVDGKKVYFWQNDNGVKLDFAWYQDSLGLWKYYPNKNLSNPFVLLYKYPQVESSYRAWVYLVEFLGKNNIINCPAGSFKAIEYKMIHTQAHQLNSFQRAFVPGIGIVRHLNWQIKNNPNDEYHYTNELVSFSFPE